MDRRRFLALASSAFASLPSRPLPAQEHRPPNIVVILADDLGYGDIGIQGSRIKTPNIDRIGREGARFTHFYAPSAVCSPARASFLTGRYAVRMNIPSVLFPDDARGIPDTETTIGHVLQQAGYRTACIGKWHVGSRPQFLPTNRGFDEFFGLPYSHDMLPLPMMRGTETVNDNPPLDRLTEQFTAEATAFIARQKDTPFFLFLSHTAPHIPLNASPQFKGKSRFGRYGDVIMELDWSTGEILRSLRENGLDDNTLVIFTSDNGPWYQGSKGALRGRKGETFEGGMRVPFLARFPGSIPAGRVVSNLASGMDLLPTARRLSGAALPGQRLDGIDIWALMTGEHYEDTREPLLYFDSWQLQCARVGRWKVHFSRYNFAPWMPGPAAGRFNLPLPRPELYDLEVDAEEVYEASIDNPEIVADVRRRVEDLLLTFPDQVRSAWRDTMSIPVEDTPVGAPPVRRVP
jgi:arylsulfatase A-like enzyme